MKLVIVNGYVIDPAQEINAGRNLLVEDGRVVDVLDRSEPLPEDAQTVDATGLIVAPGFSRPLSSASRIMPSAARSFTEPPGFSHSIFA